ncbi:MAG: hypothetical protein EBT09_08900 [Actinobacteria bacterium]|nr:hypothetical protein [Actinomycetota bacterium]
MTKKMITKTVLLARSGWSGTLVTRLLGDADQLKKIKKSSITIESYELERIQLAEASQEFRVAQSGLAKRKEASKIERLLDAIEAMPITVTTLTTTQVVANAIRYYNSRQENRVLDRDDYTPKYANPDSDSLFLERITVNYIRHELSQYDRVRVYALIAATYPQFADECDRQLAARAEAERDRVIAEEWKKYDLAVARAEAECQRVIARAEAECQRVIARAEAEYKRAIARAEAEYKRAIAPAEDEYKRAKSSATKRLKRDQARAKYDIARAWAEYRRAIAPAEAEYKRVTDEAKDKQDHAIDQAWSEHDRVRAEEWANYDGVSKKAKDKRDRVIAPALAECERVIAEAWKKYERVSEAKAKQDHADAEPEAGFDDDIMWTNLTQ